MPVENTVLDPNAQPGQQAPPAEGQQPPTPTPAAPAAPPAEKPDGKPKKVTAALSAMVGAFVNDTRASEAPGEKKPDEKKPEPKKPEAAKPAAPPAKRAVKVAPAPQAPPPPPPAPSMTAEQIAAVAEGAARAIVQKQQQPDGEAPKLSEGSEYTLKVLGQMEKLYPDQYRGVAESYRENLVELMNYAKRWEADHPGEEFNTDDPEHADFMAQHDTVDWEDHHFRKAEVRMEADDLLAQERTVVNQKLTKLEKAEELRQSEPKLKAEQLDVARNFWTAQGDEFKAAFTPDGNMDMAKFQALAEKDPAFAVRLQAATNLQLETAELYKLMERYVDLDEKNPIHVEMANFTTQCEQDEMRLPPEKRRRGGRDFLPAAEYWSPKLTPQQRERYWTFSHRDYAEMRADDLAQKVAAEIKKTDEQFRYWAAKRGVQLPTAPGNQGTDDNTPNPEPPDNNGGKPESPSASVMPRLAAAKEGASQPAEKPVNAFATRFLT